VVDSEPLPEGNHRRGFLGLGAALVSGSVLSAFGRNSLASDDSETPKRTRPKQGIDMEKWRRLKGEAYPSGTEKTPGVCQLPGPNAKRNWPDKNKYVGTKKVPGMCQLCSTICGIIGHVKDDRIHAGLNHQYHPERLLYPLKRVGKRGEGKWKRITWDEATTEIADKLRVIRESGKPENFAFHQGRQRSKDALKRFLNAFGTRLGPQRRRTLKIYPQLWLQRLRGSSRARAFRKPNSERAF